MFHPVVDANLDGEGAAVRQLISRVKDTAAYAQFMTAMDLQNLPEREDIF